MKKLTKQQHKALLDCSAQLGQIFAMQYRGEYETQEDIVRDGWKTGLWIWNKNYDKLVNLETGEYIDQQVIDVYKFIDGSKALSLDQFRSELGYCAINDSPFTAGGDVPQAQTLYKAVHTTLGSGKGYSGKVGPDLDLKDVSTEFINRNTYEFAQEILEKTTGERLDDNAIYSESHRRGLADKVLDEFMEIKLSDAVSAMQNMRDRATEIVKGTHKPGKISALDF